MKGKRSLWAGVSLLLLFTLWTALILRVDVRTVGPGDAKVGFASWNVWFHHRTGVHMALYAVTDWFGLVPVFICGGFGLTGLCQWIRRKRLLRVDGHLLLLGI